MQTTPLAPAPIRSADRPPRGDLASSGADETRFADVLSRSAESLHGSAEAPAARRAEPTRQPANDAAAEDGEREVAAQAVGEVRHVRGEGDAPEDDEAGFAADTALAQWIAALAPAPVQATAEGTAAHRSGAEIDSGITRPDAPRRGANASPHGLPIGRSALEDPTQEATTRHPAAAVPAAARTPADAEVPAQRSSDGDAESGPAHRSPIDVPPDLPLAGAAARVASPPAIVGTSAEAVARADIEGAGAVRNRLSRAAANSEEVRLAAASVGIAVDAAERTPPHPGDAAGIEARNELAAEATQGTPKPAHAFAAALGAERAEPRLSLASAGLRGVASAAEIAAAMPDLAGLRADAQLLAPPEASSVPVPPTTAAASPRPAEAGAPAPALTLPAPVDSPEFAPSLALSLGRLAREGIQEARLQLQPVETGPIDVRIRVDGTQARVDFAADVAATRAAIESGLPELASALREAGLTLSGGGVFQQPQGRNAQTHPGRSAAGTPEDGAPATAPAPLRRAAGVVDLYA